MKTLNVVDGDADVEDFVIKAYKREHFCIYVAIDSNKTDPTKPKCWQKEKPWKTFEESITSRFFFVVIKKNLNSLETRFPIFGNLSKKALIILIRYFMWNYLETF